MGADTIPDAGSEETTLLDTIGFAFSWLAAIFLVLLAVGTVTMRQPGTPVRMVVGTLIHVVLAAFAAPPVRRYLADTHGLTVNRWTVAAILVIGVLINEGIITPEIVEEVPGV